MKIPELDDKLNLQNQERIRKALTQIPRFIEELTQIKTFLEKASEISKEHPDKVVKPVRETYETLKMGRASMLWNLPLGILKPKEFKTPEPEY